MTVCQACGHPASPDNPPVKVDGYTIHQQHLTDPRSGFYGTTPDPEEDQ